MRTTLCSFFHSNHRFEEHPLPEAVIGASAGLPIGRAIKGSLKDILPDGFTVQMVGITPLTRIVSTGVTGL
jgi:hypothetical protein